MLDRAPGIPPSETGIFDRPLLLYATSNASSTSSNSITKFVWELSNRIVVLG